MSVYEDAPSIVARPQTATGLQIYGRKPVSVFQMRGTSENDATYAVGWVAKESPTFLAAILHRAGVPNFEADNVAISLQSSGDDGGFTDIEIISAANAFHVLFEAKKGWDFPSIQQLTRYRPRFKDIEKTYCAIVSVSAASARVDRDLPKHVGGVEVRHWSWSIFAGLCKAALEKTTSITEKLWLRQLDLHLQAYITMQNVDDNNVYVVSLSDLPVRDDGSPYSFRDVVTKDRHYFHPVRAGWPNFPPNYMGFRFNGRLQSVHHVEGVQVAAALSKINPNWQDYEDDHFIYALGPPMRPTQEVRTGNLYRSQRVRCAIDTLLSGACATIAEARDETQRRSPLDPFS